eukprot:2974532-Pyramimonas_sp.AAC.1
MHSTIIRSSMFDEFREKCHGQCQSLRRAFAIKFDEAGRARPIYEHVHDHPVRFTRATTVDDRHDRRIGFDEPHDVKKTRFLPSLIWKTRTDGRWSSAVALASKEYHALCYAT